MKQTIIGVVVGIVATIVLGYGYLVFASLNSRVTNIEKFLTQTVQQAQQQPQAVRSAPAQAIK